ncbi:mitochondrial 2-oxoglutarate/malate carrier protein-like [Prorops nasuta]|uniref:mitochondrial 2-oxoglutarate/malate carrier protein-like n=1 Tax=Prorops nasuta TaxID=863751 RepID=UPI0034CF8EB7
MDVVKLRMQTSTLSMSHVVKDALRTKGLRDLYVGLSASLLRQITYTTTRLGVYQSLLDFIESEHLDRPNYVAFIGIGMLSGIIGSFIGTPADLAMVKMITDSKLPPAQQRNYRNAIVALLDIRRSEGIVALWRGAMPTMGRAAIVNGIQLSTYSSTKILLKDTGYFQEDVFLQFISSMFSGFVMSTISLPVDAAKTRIMHWSEPYKPPGLFGMILKIIKSEKMIALWRGFLPYYSRAGPNTILTMISVEQLQQFYLKYFG